METGVVVGGLDPIDLGDFEEGDLAGALDCEAFEFSREIFAERDSLLGALEGEFEACVVEWLEEIVERSGFEGAQGVLVVGGDEDDGGRDIVAEQFEHVEAVALGHLNVEEEQVGFGAANLCRAPLRRSRIRRRFRSPDRSRRDGEVAARERLVVDDERADGVFGRHGPRARFLEGHAVFRSVFEGHGD